MKSIMIIIIIIIIIIITIPCLLDHSDNHH